MIGACFSVLLMCVLWGAWLHCITVAQQGDEFRKIVFKEPQLNKVMKNHVIRSEQVPNEGSCRVLCYMEPNCVSINVGPLEGGKHKCELNNATDEHPFTIFLENHQKFTYLAIENPCSSRPCLNNGTCHAGFTNKGFRCVCHVGFTGTNCHEDINECSDGSHDCHKNATCINTAGHFNCSCLPGFTGDGRLCSDCSSKFHHFEKYQDLPTVGAHAVEQFSISESLFLAFANLYSNTEKYNTDSFIYKLNDSTGKISLFQTIDTNGGTDMKHFIIDDRHFLAVANGGDNAVRRLNSVIYQWNGQRFVFFQNITTNGAISFNFFKTIKDIFLAVTTHRDNSVYSINSVIYKWNNSQFEKFQEIRTEGATASAAFFINNETFIAFANRYNTHQKHSAQSAVFKWSGQHFVKLQSLQTYGARDVKSFNNNGHTFLAFANQYNGKHNTNSFIYKWNGSHFTRFQSIQTHGAFALHPFVMCGQTYLGVANHHDDIDGYNTKSVVYQVSGSQFSVYQEISTHAAIDMTSFEYKGHTYLAIANHKYNETKHNINSTLYKWTYKKTRSQQ